jgi:hypothetical protein
MSKSNRPGVENPFTRTQMRRNTRNGKLVNTEDKTSFPIPSPSHRPDLVHRRSFVGSETASLSEYPSDDESEYSLSRPQNPYHYQSSMSNADLYAPPPSASVYSTDSDAISPANNTWRSHPAHGTYSLPNSPKPFVLPETVKVSPISTLGKGRPDSVARLAENEEPRNVGWGFVNGSRDSVKDDIMVGEGDRLRKDSEAIVFPGAEYTPIMPLNLKKKTKSDKKDTAAKHGVYANGNASRSTPALADIYRTAKDIYTSGPKGEGQKLWGVVQQACKQNKVTKRVQAQEIQLDNIYAQFYGGDAIESTSAAPRPVISGPIELTRTPSVERALTRPPPLVIKKPSKPPPHPVSASKPLLQTSNVTSKKSVSGTVITIKVGASPHVHYDAQEVVVDRQKPYGRVPQLAPAPRHRIALGFGNSASVQKGLPPSPKDIFRNKGLPPPPMPPSPGTANVGLGISLPDSRSYYHPRSPSKTPASHKTIVPAPQTTQQDFSFLEDRITERPLDQQKKDVTKEKKKSSWFFRFLSSMCNVDDDQVPDQHTARPVANGNSTSTQANKYKKIDISQPLPMQAPNGGSTANFAVASGGVGGIAPAKSLSYEELQRNEERRNAAIKGKERASFQPPSHTRVPSAHVNINPQYQFKAPPGHKKSKSSTSIWQVKDLLNSGQHAAETTGKTAHEKHEKHEKPAGMGWSRKRNDSDASFGCQGISDEDQTAYGLHAPQAIKAAYPSLNPYEESHAARVAYTQTSIRDPGPSRQISRREKHESGKDTGASPVRDTKFYGPVDDLLYEYGNPSVDGMGRF